MNRGGMGAPIAPLLAVGGRRSGQWRAHRTVINGILWKLRTRTPWRSVVARYEKCAVNSRALVVIASIVWWLPA